MVILGSFVSTTHATSRNLVCVEWCSHEDGVPHGQKTREDCRDFETPTPLGSVSATGVNGFQIWMMSQQWERPNAVSAPSDKLLHVCTACVKCELEVFVCT